MAINISGTVYTDRGVTTMGAGRHVTVSVNGAAAAGSTTTAADGTYTISAITAASGAVLTLYLQGDAENAVTVTKSTGLDMTGIDLYQDYLSIRSDQGGSFSATNLNTSDGNGATGISAVYSAGTTTASTAAGKGLCVQSGQTFAGFGFNPLTCAGHWVNLGTLSSAPTSVVLSGAGAFDLVPGSGNFTSLTLNASGGTYALGGALTTTGNLTLTAGALDVSGGNYGVTVGGNWSATAGTFAARAGTVTFNKSSGTQTLNAAGGGFHGLTHSGAGTLQLVTSGLTVSGDFANTGGTFDANGQTVTLNGTAQTLSGSTTFYDLVASTPDQVITVTDGTTQTFSNSVTLQNVTVTGTGVAGYTFAMPSTQTIDHLTIDHCTATGNTGRAGSTSTDGGGNVNWSFTDAVPTASRSCRSRGSLLSPSGGTSFHGTLVT